RCSGSQLSRASHRGAAPLVAAPAPSRAAQADRPPARRSRPAKTAQTRGTFHMSTLSIPVALGAAALIAVLASASVARADPLQSPAACQVGMRVTTSDGHTGTISRVDRTWSYCYV